MKIRKASTPADGAAENPNQVNERPEPAETGGDARAADRIPETAEAADVHKTAAAAGDKAADGKERKAAVPTLEQLEAELKKEQYRSRYGRAFRSTVFLLVVVAAAAVLVAVLLLPVLKISGTSMTETLQDGDVVIALNGSKYETGDVIAFYYNNNILVKRVIATAGDWVNIDGDGNVYVNDILLEEPYISEKALGDCNIKFPYQVPEGRNFVMGDHRATSIDSRNTAVGCVSDDSAIGKILLRVWPLSGFGLVN